MSLTQFIANRTLARRVGVFVIDVAPQRVIRARGRKKVLLVGQFPWGPDETLWDVTSEPAFLDRHFPLGPYGSGSGASSNTAFAESYGLISPGITKTFKVVGSGAAKASFTFVDDDSPSAENSLVVTALYNGFTGNQIQVSITANADDATKRDLRVYHVEASSGKTVYDATYYAMQNANGSVNVVTPVNTTTGAVETIELVTYAAASGANEAAAPLAAQTLTGGTPGTLAASDFNDGVIQALAADSDIGTVVCIGVADGIAAALNELIQTAADDAGAFGCIFALATRASRTKANHLADALLARTERARYIAPWVTRTVVFSHRGVSLTYSSTVPGTVVWAMMRAATTYHRACMLGGTPSGFRGAISGLESGWSASQDDCNDLAEAGIITWWKDQNGIYVPFDDVANYLVDGVPAAGERLIHQDYYDSAFNAFLETFLGTGKVDVQLPSESAEGKLGDYTGGVIAKMRSFLAAERDSAEAILQRQPDADTGVLDEGFAVDGLSSNTAEDVAAGRWTVAWSARATPNARSIVVNRRLDSLITF